MNRNDQMIEAAKHVLGILEDARPDKHLDIRFWKIDDETIHCFTEWERERFNILTGDERFFILDADTENKEILYSVVVSADSVLTAVAELMNLVCRKF